MAGHIIHKQKVVLTVSKDADAFGLQNKISYLLRERLPAEMEQLFDRYFPEGQTVRLESLSLDLGLLEGANVEAVFKSRLLEKLEEEIRKREETRQGSATSSVIPQQQSLQDTLIYFLRHGRLPWFQTAGKVADLEEEMVQAFAAPNWDFFWQWLRQNFQPTILQRLVYQFSDVFLFQLSKNSRDGNTISWPLFYADVVLLVQKLTGIPTASARFYTWDCVLQNLVKNQQPTAWEDVVFDLLLSFSSKQGGIGAESWPGKNEIVLVLKTPAAIKAIEKLQKVWRDEQKNPALQKPFSAPDVTKKAEAEKAGGAEAEMIEPRKPNEKEPALAEESYGQNCGVVILHPFLETLFTELQLFAHGKFTNREAHQRSVLLLHYLATGETEAGEFELLLQKIICGYPVEETLPNKIVLREYEERETAKLLLAVINYWPPLKNTSVEGLRETFLQRAGKLETVESGYRLTVEQKTVDILLGKLPWGFSTIRLPWMDSVLSVDWG